MTASPGLAIRVVLTAAALFPLYLQPVAAQAAAETVDSFADLSHVIRPGILVVVTDENGERIRGTVMTLSNSVLEVRRFSRVVIFPAERVRRVSLVDSRRDGFGIGFMAGAVAGGYLGIQTAEFCEGWDSDDGCPSAIPVLGGMFGLIGGGIGALIDNAFTGEKPVFTRSPSTAQLRVSPLVGGQTAGIRFTVKF